MMLSSRKRSLGYLGLFRGLLDLLNPSESFSKNGHMMANDLPPWWRYHILSNCDSGSRANTLG
jgi:hypothetical protein